MNQNRGGKPVGNAPGYGDLTEGNVGNQGSVDRGQQRIDPMANQNRKAAGGTIDASLKVGDVSRGLAQSGFHGFEFGPDLVLVHALEAAPCLYRK